MVNTCFTFLCWWEIKRWNGGSLIPAANKHEAARDWPQYKDIYMSSMAMHLAAFKPNQYTTSIILYHHMARTPQPSSEDHSPIGQLVTLQSKRWFFTPQFQTERTWHIAMFTAEKPHLFPAEKPLLVVNSPIFCRWNSPLCACRRAGSALFGSSSSGSALCTSSGGASVRGWWCRLDCMVITRCDGI